MSLTSPLKWHGGKGVLAGRIVKTIQGIPHLHYVEPFFGGGSVMMHKPCEGFSEVANDVHKELVNFWQVLQGGDSFAAFARLCQATPFSEPQWDDAGVELAEFPEPSEEASVGCVRAWRFFVRCRQSLAGRMDAFAPMSRNRVRRGMNEQASAWLGAVDGLPQVHQRLKRVVIFCKPAIEVIRQQDGEKVLFYLDPPYYPDARAAPDVYEHEMTAIDHVELLDCLLSVKGKVVLSGYPCALYDSTLAGWKTVDIDIANHAAGGASKRRMVERLYIKS